MKKNQKTIEKRLTLRKETLRPLTMQQLNQVAGGNDVLCTVSTYSARSGDCA
jgi:hypothetical protein